MNRAAFVIREIVTGTRAQVRKNAAQDRFIVIAIGREGRLLLRPYELRQSRSQFPDGEDEIRSIRGNDAARHGGIFGLFGILDKYDAPRFLDGSRTDGAVRSCAGQDHGAAVAFLLGQRTEKKIDRGAMAARLVE